MRLNAQTDFSVRIMMYLAAKGSGHVTIQEISGRLGLSQAHLMRIAAKLVSRGLLVSIRGRCGGLALARQAGEITIEEIVRAIEPDFALVECLRSSERCTVRSACSLAPVFEAALGAFFEELGKVTLEDLLRPNKAKLIEVFGLVEGRGAG